MKLNLTKKDADSERLLLPETTTAQRVKFDTSTEIFGMEDIIESRHLGRVLAQRIGFSEGSATLVATVISELARNIVLYAHEGKIVLRAIQKGRRRGLLIVASDDGPGIENIQDALMSGYSSSGGLGLGLSGVRQIVDEFDIESRKGKGTKVTAALWL